MPQEQTEQEVTEETENQAKDFFISLCYLCFLLFNASVLVLATVYESRLCPMCLVVSD